LESRKPYVVDGERLSHDEYVKTRYEDLRIRVPKGRKAAIQAAAEAAGESVNAYISAAVDERMGREGKEQTGGEPG
jgi:predicted HicB family RNase H-like nuclease